MKHAKAQWTFFEVTNILIANTSILVALRKFLWFHVYLLKIQQKGKEFDILCIKSIARMQLQIK